MLTLLLRAFHDALSKIGEAIPNYPCLYTVHFSQLFKQYLGPAKVSKQLEAPFFNSHQWGDLNVFLLEETSKNVCPYMADIASQKMHVVFS